MDKSKSLPGHTIVVRTYAELEKFVLAFASGCLNLLLLLGSPGLGKSQVVRQALDENAYWIDGNASAIGVYMAAYEHRGRPLALDDVDGLHRDRQGVRLLKCLCQMERQKTLSWETNAPALQARGIPRRFTTTSRLVLIANDWRSLNQDVAALEDRGHIIYFDPSPLEIHLHAAKYFWDQEIFDFVGAHLHLIERHSLRTYFLAHEQKLAGLDWHRGVLSRCLSGAALEVAKLKADSSFKSEKDRAAAFAAAGHGCRATYFNHAKKLKAVGDVPPIQLSHNAPPAVPPTDILEILHWRRRGIGEG